jgi:hypothetical protein
MRKQIYFMCCLFMVMFFVLDITTPLSMADGALYISIIFLSVWAANKRFTITLAYFSTVLTMVGFLFPHHTFRSPSELVTDRVLSIVLIWLITFSTMRRIEVNEQNFVKNETLIKLEKELAFLRALHNICPECLSRLHRQACEKTALPIEDLK